MDVFTSGPNTGNLLVTIGLVAVLLVMSSRARMLDRACYLRKGRRGVQRWREE